MDSLPNRRDAPDKFVARRDNADDRIAEILKVIRPGSVLGTLAQQDLLTLLRQSTVRTLPRQRVLFRAGDAGRSVILGIHGYVKLSTTAANGREMVLEIAGPGTIFGEIAVLSGSTRQADATCLTACRVLAIDKATFHHVLARTPEAMFAAIRLICERLSMTTARGIDIVSLPAPARLAKVLLHLVDLHAQHREDGVQIDFRLSQRELGAMTGLIRESINKHLNAWRAAGWVALSGGAVTLLDMDALRAIVRDSETTGKTSTAE